jgi:serine/threonine-protein kinase
MLCLICLSEHDECVPCPGVDWLQEGPAARVERHAAPPVPDLVGRTLGRYRLVRRLGSGSMGTVYLAEQPLIQARVALKVLHPHLAREERHRARFHAEACTVNRIRHPQLVRSFGIDEDSEGIPYLIMEYLEGKPLSRFPRPVEPELLQHLLVQACDVLDAAHRAGVLHGDLKPGNLYVMRHAGEAPKLKVLGFAPSMPPVHGMALPVDGRADVYALGAAAYRMATGQLPFARGQVTPPHVLHPRMPKAFSEVLLQALAWRPEERFTSALDFKRALLGEQGAMPSSGPRLEEPGEEGHGSTWRVRVHRLDGGGDVEVRGTELGRGGIFLCCAEPLPRLLTILTFSLWLDGQEVECAGEVVRHVDSAQARAWGMGPGVGLQFVNPSPRLRELLQHPRPSRS